MRTFLDDVHWVGGNPWNKETNEGAVYGWAAWNKNKATLALRNSSDQEKSLTGTLRSILDILRTSRAPSPSRIPMTTSGRWTASPAVP